MHMLRLATPSGGSARDCGELYVRLSFSAGVRTIDVRGDGGATDVFCDEDGWTVFQSRGQFGNAPNYFYNNFDAYVRGFGVAGPDTVLYV